MENTHSTKHILIDIETTGIQKHHDFIVCIGVLYITTSDNIKSPHYYQWISKTIDEEKSNLISFINFIKDFSHIYSFSGKSFDIPFLIARCAFHNIGFDIFKDIYLVDIKKPLLNFATNRLNLETLLDFKRQSMSTGRELAKICKLYQNSSENIYKSIILSHNHDELYSLLAFYEVYTTLLGLKNTNNASISETNLTNNYLVFNFISASNFLYNFCATYNNISISWAKNTSDILIKVGLYNVNLKKYLLPAKDYYYIISQKQIVHRSIAQFIDKNDKQKVHKDECYISKQNSYAPLITTHKLQCPIWYNECKAPFITYSDLTPSILASQLSNLVLVGS